MKRHQCREFALQILYHMEMNFPEELQTGMPAEDISKNIITHHEHFKVPQAMRAYTGELVSGVALHFANFDEKIASVSKNWKLDRMPMIDKNIIRIALFEVYHKKDVPPAVAIHEALELSKSFGSDQSKNFIHGILDAIFQSEPVPTP